MIKLLLSTTLTYTESQNIISNTNKLYNSPNNPKFTKELIGDIKENNPECFNA